uniref:Uncharacterized protein n=1 Tax=Aegilops tauschii subsp. strangulata TaxID=200361 RepID=A0A452XT07_AEGTS
GSYGGRSGGDGTGHGHGGSARGGRGARGSEHEQANGFWGGLRRRLKKIRFGFEQTLDERDLLENLEELHYQVERIERIQNLPERIAAIGQKFHDHWVTVSLAFSTMYATVSGKVQDQAVSVKAKMIDQAVSVKAKMIGVKDRLKERLSPQKVRPNDDQPEDEPIAIPLATDFSP